jgi:hypothetical protein
LIGKNVSEIGLRRESLFLQTQKNWTKGFFEAVPFHSVTIGLYFKYALHFVESFSLLCYGERAAGR